MERLYSHDFFISALLDLLFSCLQLKEVLHKTHAFLRIVKEPKLPRVLYCVIVVLTVITGRSPIPHMNVQLQTPPTHFHVIRSTPYNLHHDIVAARVCIWIRRGRHFLLKGSSSHTIRVFCVEFIEDIYTHISRIYFRPFNNYRITSRVTVVHKYRDTDLDLFIAIFLAP